MSPGFRYGALAALTFAFGMLGGAAATWHFAPIEYHRLYDEPLNTPGMPARLVGDTDPRIIYAGKVLGAIVGALLWLLACRIASSWQRKLVRSRANDFA